MLHLPQFNRRAVCLMVLILCAGTAEHITQVRAADNDATQDSATTPQPPSQIKQKPDLSGRKRVGKASIYGKEFAGKKMADGKKMDPHDDNAASKTLPLGTTAKVTNIETGQSTNVTIQDRGPYVKGRIVDLSPSSAKKIGITKDDGVAKVKVVPIAVPQPDGTVKAGAAAQSEDK